MTREEFLYRLNNEASHFEPPETTDGILSDWLEAKIIEAPQQHGRIRDWSEIELTRARKILRLKSLGVKNLGEIRFHLWLDDQDISFFDPKFDAPGILFRQFQPLKKKLFSQIRSAYPENRNPSPDSYSAKCVLRKLGGLDSCFEPWVEYSAQELLDGYTTLRFGNSKGCLEEAGTRLIPKISARLIPIILGRFPKVAAHVMGPSLLAISEKILRPLVQHLRLDQMEASILDASKSEFLLARRAFNVTGTLFSLLGLQKVSDSLRHPAWQITMFVLLLHLIHTGNGARLGIQPEVFDFIEKLHHKPMISVT